MVHHLREISWRRNAILRRPFPAIRASFSRGCVSDESSGAGDSWHSPRARLREAVARASEPRHAYLAHLFLGQVYEDSNDLDHAQAEYRAATELDPEAQSVAVALSRALQLVGEGEESLRVLEHGLEAARRRSKRDPYWDYLVANALGLEDLIETLGQEALN